MKLHLVKKLLILLFLFPYLYSNITLEEIDDIRLISDKNSKSIIENGSSFCNEYFSKKSGLSKINKNKFSNIFLCKFSEKRNRFYIYMLSVQKKDKISLKNFCISLLEEWPEISDHLNPKLGYQKKDYLDGFYIENFFFDKVLSFSDNVEKDQQLINNEIDNFILKNRNNFSTDNRLNNDLIKAQLKKITKIQKKILSNSTSDLDIVIKQQLDQIVRYKIFVNDVKNFQSYSCNWKPRKGDNPYIKREKFKEFEKI